MEVLMVLKKKNSLENLANDRDIHPIIWEL